MKTELEDVLFHKYQKIFADKDKPATQTAMCWGVACKDGWYSIIDTLCFQIQSEIDRTSKEVEQYSTWIADPKTSPNKKLIYQKKLELSIANQVPQIKATQVKEKFGTLRFYTDYSHPTIDALINFAEDLSLFTCEICGAPGTINSGGWLKVRCEKHKED